MADRGRALLVHGNKSTIWQDRQLVVPLGSRPGCRWPLASRPDLAFMARDAQLEAVSDPVRPLDEVIGGRRRTDIAGGRGKDLEPTVEMRRVDRQRQMRGHRLTMITATHQRDGRPERAHATEMTFPVLHTAFENRPD